MEDAILFVVLILSLACTIHIEFRYRAGEPIEILEPLISFGCKLLAALTGGILMDLPVWGMTITIVIAFVIGVFFLFRR